MAAGFTAATIPKPLLRHASASFFPPPRGLRLGGALLRSRRQRLCLTVCVLMEDKRQTPPETNPAPEIEIETNAVDADQIPRRVAEKLARKKSERFTYLVAAVMSSFGVTSMAIMAVYYRFYWQMEVCTYNIFFYKYFLFCFVFFFISQF